MTAKHTVRNGFIYSVMLATLLVASSAYAYSPEPELLELKGYSPQTIRVADVQKHRQEWRNAPPPLLSPTKRFFRNIFYNNWVGSMDEFGYGVIRNYQ